MTLGLYVGLQPLDLSSLAERWSTAQFFFINLICMTSRHGMGVGPWSLFGEVFFTKCLSICLFDCTTVARSGKVRP